MSTTTHDVADATAIYEDGALGIAQAVEFSALSRAELYRAMARGDLPFQVYGRRRLVSRRGLVELLTRGRARKG